MEGGLIPCLRTLRGGICIISVFFFFVSFAFVFIFGLYLLACGLLIYIRLRTPFFVFTILLSLRYPNVFSEPL